MINIMQKKLNDLIEANNGNLQAEEIIRLSQELDKYIVIEQKKRRCKEGDR